MYTVAFIKKGYMTTMSEEEFVNLPLEMKKGAFILSIEGFGVYVSDSVKDMQEISHPRLSTYGFNLDGPVFKNGKVETLKSKKVTKKRKK